MKESLEEPTSEEAEQEINELSKTEKLRKANNLVLLTLGIFLGSFLVTLIVNNPC